MNRPRRLIAIALGAALLLAATTRPCRADLDFGVTLDTSMLISHPAAPFSIDFQLNPGAGTGTNTATISNFAFDTGDPLGSPTYQGSASGALSSSVNLSEGSFLNEFTQAFTAGNTLSFEVKLTTDVVTPTPDQFTFAILDCMGNEIPTLGPIDAIVIVNLDSSNPTIQSYGGDPSRAPSCGGPPIPFAAAAIRAVPEPSSMALTALGLSAVLVLRKRRANLRLS